MSIFPRSSSRRHTTPSTSHHRPATSSWLSRAGKVATRASGIIVNDKDNHSLAKKIAATAGAAGAAGAAAALLGASRFRLAVTTIPMLDKGTFRGRRQEFRILHISDLHMLPHQHLKQLWISELAELAPDLVVNTGDNLGDPKAVPTVVQTLNPLLTTPGLFCFGTNDYWAPSPPNPLRYLTGKKQRHTTKEMPWKGLRAVFKEHGWEDCTHQRHDFAIDGFRLAVAGVDDPHGDLDDYSLIAGAPNKDADLSIGLTHSPEPRILDAFVNDGYQLILAGHTHGGQLCLPGGKPIITNSGIDRDHASGVSEWKNTILNVSPGLGTSKYAPIRTFCPPTAQLLRIVEKGGGPETDTTPPHADSLPLNHEFTEREIVLKEL
ncbi:metallophosphoesterase [Corynebacterium kroppenstedtii]|uniref:metallophosphoesterase n=1 Tax=Corynebacterium sp. PCR 32 TaxID=3351342 RepID=UPI0030A6612B